MFFLHKTESMFYVGYTKVQNPRKNDYVYLYLSPMMAQTKIQLN